MEQAIGIDIGTTRCCCSHIKGNSPSTIPSSTGSSLTPSFVSIISEDKILVGDAAMNHMGQSLGDTVYATKRLIGRNFDDKQVQEDIKNLNYVVKNGLDGKPIIVVNEDTERELHFTPVDICTFILKQMKEDAKKAMDNNEEVKKAVITVPAYFNDEQRKETKLAAEKAGFEVLRIINEPTAAAIAYSFIKITDDSRAGRMEGKERDSKTMLVYDLGGGTFDVSIIEVKGNEINVIATGGDSHLGGEDFTNSLVEEVKRLHEEETGNIIKKRKELIRLRKACENAKILLSEASETIINIKDEYDYTITRERFTAINHELFEKTIEIVNKTLKEKNKRKEVIDDIILIGGGSKMPQIPYYIEKYFPKSVKINKDINQDEAVSRGAAIVANELLCQELKIIRDDSGVYNIINDETKEAYNEDEYTVVIDYKNHKGNINKCVVERDNRIYIKDKADDGDKIVIPSLKYRPVINDILTHSIGYEVVYKNEKKHVMDVCIRKNEKIPITKKKTFKTIYDNQTSIPVSIYEGEDKYVENNTKIDEFEVKDIPILPEGKYYINIITSINENGILEIEVHEDETNRILAVHRTDITNRSSFK